MDMPSDFVQDDRREYPRDVGLLKAGTICKVQLGPAEPFMAGIIRFPQPQGTYVIYVAKLGVTLEDIEPHSVIEWETA